MGSSLPPSRLTPLQRDLLTAFFDREKRFVLTGGAALAGFYFGHRDTDDLDLFGDAGTELQDAVHALSAAAAACGAALQWMQRYPDFHRAMTVRGDEKCVVDLVIDRTPRVDPQKATFGTIVVDTLREIASNKICTVLSRSEIKDLVDLQELVEEGIDLEQVLADAARKDGSVDPATLAWLLDEIRIGPHARLPGGVDPVRLVAFRDELVRKLRTMAFARATRDE